MIQIGTDNCYMTLKTEDSHRIANWEQIPGHYEFPWPLAESTHFSEEEPISREEQRRAPQKHRPEAPLRIDRNIARHTRERTCTVFCSERENDTSLDRTCCTRDSVQQNGLCGLLRRRNRGKQRQQRTYNYARQHDAPRFHTLSFDRVSTEAGCLTQWQIRERSRPDAAAQRTRYAYPNTNGKTITTIAAHAT